MVGSLTCAVCDELLVLDDPGQLRPAARRFCSRHRHPHGSRLLAQFGGQPVEVTSIEQLLGDVAESRHQLSGGASDVVDASVEVSLDEGADEPDELRRPVGQSG